MNSFKSAAGLLVLILCTCNVAVAWGPVGHKVVGALAIDKLNPDASKRLVDLMGTGDLEQLTDWCNWPDEYRETDDGAWSSPLHYVNIPVGAETYNAARDCRQDLCVTEAIPRYASELSDVTLDAEQRQKAFGFLCHFVGDLSQTLHAGFGHDRGGNDFAITFQGEELNLHEFWDSTLINLHTSHWIELFHSLQTAGACPDTRSWNPAMAIKWTNESHQLAIRRAYPDNPEISDAFSEESWGMIRQQLITGGRNLALVLNAVLGSRCDDDRSHQSSKQPKDPGPP